MLYVAVEAVTDPRVNLAIEEHLLRHATSEEPILLFYINEPSVIIGRNQNTYEEIDLDYVKDRNIHVVRRLSGGGAVYHDLGNLNFSFVTSGSEDLHNFAKFTGPVIQVLGDLGVKAELRGRSDIFAGEKKISGNAQYATGGRMFSHGTLLFDTDIEEMLKALNPRQAQIESKAVASVRNFVTNIRELLSEDIDIYGLKEALLTGIFGPANVPLYELNQSDWDTIDQISTKRYQQWDWNFGHSPKFNVQKKAQTKAGRIDVRLDVHRGRIQSLKIYGDFTGKRPIEELEEGLARFRYDRDQLTAELAGIDLQPYLGDIEKADFMDLLF